MSFETMEHKQGALDPRMRDILSMEGSLIRARVRTCIAQTLDRDEQAVDMDKALVIDLGAQSIDMLDLVFRIESACGVRVSATDVASLTTSSDAVEGTRISYDVGRVLELIPTLDPNTLEERLKTDQLEELVTGETFARLVALAKSRGDTASWG